MSKKLLLLFCLIFVSSVWADDTLHINVKAQYGTQIRNDTVAVDTSASFTPTWLGTHTFGANVNPTATGNDLGTSGTPWDAYIRDLDVNGTLTGLIVDS